MVFLVKKLKKIVIISIIVFIVFGLGFYFGEIEGRTKFSPSDDLDLSLFWEAYHSIEEKYVDPGKIDSKDIVYGAIAGMVKSLNDPYTVFMKPEDAKIFNEDIKGEFQGVGMEIGIRKGQLTVIAPLENTPAQKAGLKPGDKIIKVDDALTVDLTIDEAVKIIRGPKGTEVCLTVFRDDWSATKEIKIIRDVIEVPSLKWEIKEDNIAYIKIYHFSEKANQDFKQAALKILNTSATGIILDLRNNPGGYLEVAQDIAGWFLEKDQIVVIEDFSKLKKRKEYKSKGPSKFLSFPVVVLINQGSASGSEILAGALRDNRKIKLIGEKSFGKGTVQELKKLQKGSLKITVANWLTPNGNIITEKGLEPDIKIEITEQDYDQNKDPQLDKAIEIIKKIR